MCFDTLAVFFRYYNCGPLAGKLFVIAAMLNLWFLALLTYIMPAKVGFHEWWWSLYVPPFTSHLRFFCFLFVLEVEISSRTLIPLFLPGPVHSGSASWDDCGRRFPDKLHMSLFPHRFPHCAWTVA